MKVNKMQTEAWKKHLHISAHSDPYPLPYEHTQAILLRRGKSGPELSCPNYAVWDLTSTSWSAPTTFPSLPHLPHEHMREQGQNQPNLSQISWIPQTHELNKCLLLFASKFWWLFIMSHYAVISKLYTMSPFIFFFFPRA